MNSEPDGVEPNERKRRSGPPYAAAHRRRSTMTVTMRAWATWQVDVDSHQLNSSLVRPTSPGGSTEIYTRDVLLRAVGHYSWLRGVFYK